MSAVTPRSNPRLPPPITVSVVPHPLRITISRGGQAIMRWTASTLSVARVAHVRVHHLIAWDFFRDHNLQRLPMRYVVSDRTIGQDRLLELGYAPFQVDLCIHFHWDAPHHLTWQMTGCRPGFQRLGWGFESNGQEILQGFGQRSHPIAAKARFDTWVEEGAVGLGPLSPWLRWTGRVPIPKGGYTSPAPLSWWMSNQGYVAWLEADSMVRFQRRRTSLYASIWQPSTRGHIISYDHPLQALTESSAIIGRPSLVPPWVFAPWNDSVGGEDQVRALAQFLRSQRIPSSAVWTEDWTGSQQNHRRFWMRPLSHQLNRDQYPGIETLSEDLHRQGFRLLGYFCPEITRHSPLYEEACKYQHLVLDDQGCPVTINILGIAHGELDLSQERTRAWVKERLLKPALTLGFDGWMADFGEYLPVHSRLADGSSGWESHNRYPRWWQALHQQFWQHERPDGDFVYFTRSASLGSQSTVSVMWGGDSDTDWDAADGLASVVPQLLSASLSGFPYWGTDIAGYMSFGLTPPASKELFCRWLQLGALCPVMRTHHGTARPRNWHFQKDAETLALYTRYARLHAALGPYWYALARKASQVGWPIARALFLHYPDQAQAWSLQNQFFIGSDLLVAPVVEPQAVKKRVWIPPGGWRHWWQGTLFSGPGFTEIDAPLAELPLFIRQGAVLPLFEGARDQSRADFQLDGLVDTFTTAEGLTDWNVSNQTLTLLATELNEPQELSFGDGTVIRLSTDSKATPVLVPLQPAPTALAHDHLPSVAGPGYAAFLSPGQSATFPPSRHPLTLNVLSGPARWYVVRSL